MSYYQYYDNDLEDYAHHLANSKENARGMLVIAVILHTANKYDCNIKQAANALWWRRRDFHNFGTAHVLSVYVMMAKNHTYSVARP